MYNKIILSTFKYCFKYCFSCQTKTGPMNGIQQKFEQVFNDCLLKETQCRKNVVHIRLSYKVTYNKICKIISTKTDNKSFNPDLIILYMKKFLDCDWLRRMQFLGNTVQKKGN